MITIILVLIIIFYKDEVIEIIQTLRGRNERLTKEQKLEEENKKLKEELEIHKVVSEKLKDK